MLTTTKNDHEYSSQLCTSSQTILVVVVSFINWITLICVCVCVVIKSNIIHLDHDLFLVLLYICLPWILIFMTKTYPIASWHLTWSFGVVILIIATMRHRLCSLVQFPSVLNNRFSTPRTFTLYPYFLAPF